MNTQQQAYIKGFVKRAAEYGYSTRQAEAILKQANMPAGRPILRGALSPRERENDRIIQEQIAYNNRNPVDYASSRPATDTQQKNMQAGLGYHSIDSTGGGVRYSPQTAQTASAPAQPNAKGYTQAIGPALSPASEGYDYPIGPTQPDNFKGEMSGGGSYMASNSLSNLGQNLTGNQPSMSPPAALLRNLSNLGQNLTGNQLSVSPAATVLRNPLNRSTSMIASRVK
jgi:hypothetical protein